MPDRGRSGDGPPDAETGHGAPRATHDAGKVVRGVGDEATGSRRAVFIDRDGTLIQEKEYLADPEGVQLVAGAVEALRRLRGLGLAVVVVTNQSGIARGLYEEDDYRAVARRLARILDDAGVLPDGTYYCPHHPSFTGPCPCRKPGTGMYREAARDLDLMLQGSYYVGDRVKDTVPARVLRGTGILVRTGFGGEEETDAPADVLVVDHLPAAADLITRREAGGDGPRRGAG